jgi:hypothetical protein
VANRNLNHPKFQGAGSRLRPLRVFFLALFGGSFQTFVLDELTAAG